jgi:outer membrane protein assembly factor BamD (BamD/ComL family)
MELSGKVIIFKTEDEAKIWYETIEDAMKHREIESAKRDFESWKESQERFKNEAPSD